LTNTSFFYYCFYFHSGGLARRSPAC